MDQHVIDYLKGQPYLLSKLNDELSRIDLGVEGLRFQEGPDGRFPLFKHSGLQVEMSWLMVSHGTHAFIKMFPFLMQAA